MSEKCDRHHYNVSRLRYPCRAFEQRGGILRQRNSFRHRHPQNYGPDQKTEIPFLKKIVIRKTTNLMKYIHQDYPIL